MGQLNLEIACSIIAAQDVARCGIHKVDLLARDAADRFIGPFIGRHFFSGPALHVIARIRAAIKERRHATFAMQISRLARAFVSTAWKNTISSLMISAEMGVVVIDKRIKGVRNWY